MLLFFGIHRIVRPGSVRFLCMFCKKPNTIISFSINSGGDFFYRGENLTVNKLHLRSHVVRSAVHAMQSKL